MSDELKTCPFCGAPASFERVDDHPIGPMVSVGCSTEGCHGFQSMKMYNRKKEALAGWNRRPAAVPVGKLMERIEKAKEYGFTALDFRIVQRLIDEAERSNQ